MAEPERIRLASNRDQDGIIRTIKAVFDEYAFTWDPPGYHADLYDLDAHYSGLGHQFWVYEDASGIVGTVALETHDVIPGTVGTTIFHEDYFRACGSDCSLNRLYVHPDARRQGVGHALTQHTVLAARSAGRKIMELWSDKRFGDAHRLYGRYGAEVVGERICDDPDVSPEWGLIIRL